MSGEIIGDIDERQLAAIAQQIISSLAKPAKNTHLPTAVILGGQPAAGKTGLIATIKQSGTHRDFIEINGDDLRSWHPYYWDYLKENDATAADRTQRAVNYWVEALIHESLRRRQSVIVEGTMRKPTVPLNTAKLFKSNGFRVEVFVMAIPFWQSEVRIFERYELQKAKLGYGRFSNLAIHKEAYDNLPNSLAALLESGLIDAVSIYGRNRLGPVLLGTSQQLDSPDNRAQIFQILAKERATELTDETWPEYDNLWDSVLRKMHARKASAAELAQAVAFRRAAL